MLQRRHRACEQATIDTEAELPWPLDDATHQIRKKDIQGLLTPL